jgi:hypothetical protein
MFVSKGYFKSWNCLREVRQAVLVHSAGLRAAAGDSKVRTALVDRGPAERAACADIVARRSKLGLPLGVSSIILIRETDEQNHGGVSKAELLGQCPELIGCADHVFGFVRDCDKCGGCAVDVRAALQAHADGHGGAAIDWVRAKVHIRQAHDSLLFTQATASR